MLVTINQSKQALCTRDLRDTSQNGGRTCRRTCNFQFIEEVQNCSDLWDVSSAAYKDTRSKSQISTDIPFRPNLSVIPTLSVSSPAINIQQEQDKRGNSSRVPLHFIGHFANLACFVI